MAMVGVGPYGGSYGESHFIDTTADPPIGLNKVQIWSSANAPNAHINGLSFTYLSASGSTITIPKTWGSQQGVPNMVPVSDNQNTYLVKVFGKHDNNSVKSISFVTSDGTTHGPYGDTSPTAANYIDFQIPVQNGAILGFFGNSGTVLNAVGAYVAPLRP